MSEVIVYGIGNPLIDIIINVEDKDLQELDLHKGTMQLIHTDKREKILGYLKDKTKCYSCGGSCPNTMIALAALGIPAALGGKIGSDENSHIYKEQLARNFVVSELKSAEGITGTSVILVTPDSERTMNTYLGNCQHFSPEDVNPQLIQDARYFYFTGYMWDTETQKKAIHKALTIAEGHEAKIIFDVADPFAVNRYREDFLHLIADEADIVFANQEEARILYGMENPVDCVKKLSEHCAIAVVKIGSKGALVQERGGPLLRIPANSVKAVDTTGAGDMFAAGFIYALTQGYTLEKAGICASYLASQIIQQYGSQFDPDKLEELKEVMAKGTWDYTRSGVQG